MVRVSAMRTYGQTFRHDPSGCRTHITSTRLTSGHSKKIENHVHMVALYTTWCNFAHINSAVRMSPAMAARLETRLWDIGDIVKLIEEWEAQA
jgi:hypothetical protein